MTIGLCFLISETATAVGCLFDMCAGVQALTIIAIGLCLPDFYASQLAAESKFHNKAEAALGYLLATNAVKIFVGLGLPWTIKGLSTSGAANSLGQGIGLYLGGDQTADISLAVVMLAIISVLVIGTLQVRRTLFDGELGGSGCSRAVTACFMIVLWIIFILISFCNCFKYIGTRDIFRPELI